MIERQYGDITIRRAANGWMVITDSEHQEGEIQIFIYEDKDDLEFSESLYNLLRDQFECYMHSKRQPGIKISHSKLIKEEEDL
jgi:hypothetical protein